ncbi:G-type lectin S-receptor-like serine/threonine-protein kinase At1g61460 [Rosa rugosa]|uniref:G-type lectin S-receptor-like serine/threonine-protein kinase At1g61460 n=1 Tax=Rosa rugosa TaxID=74645 RepID=UPI002B4044CE|nr:G-type lectin S-receptor-like serine/threonine-protein kinase At1g61460 [Rosa rugosa]
MAAFWCAGHCRLSLLPSQYGAEVYSITPSHPLAEGQTLVSPGLIFKLGFFSPNSSGNKYVGLWHKSFFPRKYVWIANREIPLAATDTLATLSICSNGNLELVDGKQSSVWSANISNCSSAVLLDNGNFIVKDGMGVDLWVSFNDPSDTHLPSMLLGTRYLSYSFDKIPGDKVLAYANVSSECILRFLFSVSGKNWYLDYESWNNPCDNYGTCGPLGHTNHHGQLYKGGFGPVYKGLLPEGKEIAVERLSSSSGQGVDEFKNEMLLISNLQHKNLVRIMGCSVKQNEKLLIYEFMPNKSLDTFLYDPTKRAVLDWAKRFNIILGVAKGLLYLYHDSYVKVIHRDLKVSNILLDEKMNPKI